MVILFQNAVFGEIQFSQKSLTNRKKQPLTLSRKVLVHEPENETKILEKGVRGDKGSPEQNESPIPDLSIAL